MIKKWNPEGTIKSKLLPIEIAINDYWEASDDESPMVIRGKKRYFTWAEATAIKAEGWRLPTKAEWTGLCVEFGEKDGDIDKYTLAKTLKLSCNGNVSFDLLRYDDIGYYWSSTISSTSRAYYLIFGADITVDPFYNAACYYGFSVRLVRDVKE